jgi:hypothetical protein
MRALSLMLRLYPRKFQIRFAAEMLQTLEAAGAEARNTGRIARVVFLSREAVGMVRGLGSAWVLRADEVPDGLANQLHRLSGLTAAIAIQCFAYGTLVPIGPRAAANLGAGLFAWGAAALLVTVALEGCCLAIDREGRR